MSDDLSPMLVDSDPRLRQGVERTVADAQLSGEPEWGDAYPWPSLDRAALYGLAGEIVEAIAPNTEAAPVAMLLTLLAAFGNAAGADSRAMVGDDEHPPRLFVALVGPTASGAKGTSLGAIRPILRAADDAWFSAARVNGFASGEAIIARLGGYLRAAEDEPIEKRALVIEPEFSRLLVVNSRDGSTASQVLRGAWDEGRLQHIRAKHELLASGAQLSLIGHVTPDELRAKMTATDISGGFANRVLFACVRRAQSLPSPPSVDSALVGALAKRLRAAIDFARERRTLERKQEAEALWAEFYDSQPDRDGIVGEITARSAPQRLRLSVVYALLDESPVIRPEHVLAAEAVWRYCADSVEHLFGGLRGDRVQDQLLVELRKVYPDGLDGAAQHAVFGRNVTAERLRAARQALERRDLICTQHEPTGGRERVVSFAVPLRTNEKLRNNAQDELLIRLSSYVRTSQGNRDALDEPSRRSGVAPTGAAEITSVTAAANSEGIVEAPAESTDDLFNYAATVRFGDGASFLSGGAT